ncbi:MAG: hypothetical protein IIC79_01065 [Chloroflexi bacterium]|nr:hypothetical protein [Chloroflexota bacterium]
MSGVELQIAMGIYAGTTGGDANDFQKAFNAQAPGGAQSATTFRTLE